MQDIQVLTIPVSAINQADTGFQISETGDGHSSSLAVSMAEMGMISLPLVTPADQGDYLIVSGFKRIIAAACLGWKTISARVVSGCAPKDLVGMAIAENAYQRELGPGELVRAMALLSRYMDVGEIAQKSPAVFNTRYKAGYIKPLIQINELPAPALSLLDRGLLSIKAARAISGSDGEDAGAFLALFEAVKVSSSKQMEIITWIREICAKDNCRVKDFCREMAPAPDADGHKDRSAAGNRLRARLYRRRFPVLDLAKKEAAARVQSLKLPKGVRMTLPENFESMVYSISMGFKSPKEFQDRVGELAKLSLNDDFNALLDR